MTFQEAFELMRSGKNVKRKGWFIRMGLGDLFCTDKNQPYTLSPMDVYKDDWMLESDDCDHKLYQPHMMRCASCGKELYIHTTPIDHYFVPTMHFCFPCGEKRK